jgi:uncharacterized protein (UPF0216 family)
MIIHCLLSRIRKHEPGLRHKLERLISEEQPVPRRVEQQGELPILIRNEFEILGQATELENHIVIIVVIVLDA